MTINPTIDLGNILVAIAMLGSAIAVVVGVRVEVKGLKDVVGILASRLDKHEETVFTLAGQVQRLVGQMDGRQRRTDMR